MNVIVFTNDKGGVGKTTSAVQYFYLISRAKPDSRILLIELDPQSNVSASLGVRDLITDDGNYCVGNVLLGEESFAENLITPSMLVQPLLDPEFAAKFGLTEDRIRKLVNGRRNLYILPASPQFELVVPELERMSTSSLAKRRGFNLNTLLVDKLEQDLLTYTDGDDDKRQPGFEYVLVDCPPHLGTLKTAVYNFGDHAVVPSETEFLSFQGAQKHTRQLAEMKADPELNGLIRLNLHTILPTQMPTRKQLQANDVLEAMRKVYNLIVADPIPKLVAVSEAPSYGLSLFEYCFVINVNSPALTSYASAVRRILV